MLHPHFGCLGMVNPRLKCPNEDFGRPVRKRSQASQGTTAASALTPATATLNVGILLMSIQLFGVRVMFFVVCKVLAQFRMLHMRAIKHLSFHSPKSAMYEALKPKSTYAQLRNAASGVQAKVRTRFARRCPASVSLSARPPASSARKPRR